MDYYRGVVEGTQTELWPHLRLWDDGTDAISAPKICVSPPFRRRTRSGS